MAAKPDAPMNRSALVYIGSESYDAPTITVLQGLHHLGWTVYTLGKPNINSWFCNTVVESLDGLQVDFALSNLHWGTRWSLYGTPALDGLPRVLIDGDDSLPGESWRERHARYTRTYGSPPPGHEQLLVQPERWMEPLGDYRPDVLFVSQKQPGDATSAYLPFGIHDEYLNLAHDRPVSERSIDTLYVYGPGRDRTQMTRFLRAAELLRLLTRNTVLGEVRGDDVLAEEIADAAARDNGVHGYYRWTHSRAYFEALGSSLDLRLRPAGRDELGLETAVGGARERDARPHAPTGHRHVGVLARRGVPGDRVPIAAGAPQAIARVDARARRTRGPARVLSGPSARALHARADRSLLP